MSISQRVPVSKESYARGMTSNTGLVNDRAQAETIANGAAAAAMLAAGIGSAAFGLIVVLSESIEAFHDQMAINSSVGPLSGKSTYAVLIWLATWGLLHLLLRRREVNFKAAAIIAALLIAIGVISTFPPFFMLFAYE
jgi:hypothetical protein